MLFQMIFSDDFSVASKWIYKKTKDALQFEAHPLLFYVNEW